MKEIDNTPIESFDQDWGNPDGTGKKAKSLEQVQAFLKKHMNNGYKYISTATPSTAPVTLTGDEKVFYIATEEGDYSNFGLGNISELSVIKSDGGSWSVESSNIPFLNFEQLFSQSYTSHPYVLKNAMVNIDPPNNTYFMWSQNWDLAFIKIYNDSLTLRIEGLTGTNNLIGYFTAPTLDDDSYITTVLTNKSVYNIPSGAKYAVIDIRKENNVDYSLLRVYQEGLPVSGAEVNLRLGQAEERIDILEENITVISDYIEINDYEYKEGFFVTPTGEFKANSSFKTNVYNISNLEYHKLYASAGIGSNTNIWLVSYFTSDDIYIGSEYYYDTPTIIKSAELHIPAETGIIKVSTSRAYTAKLEKTVSEGIIDIKRLQDEIDTISSALTKMSEKQPLVPSETKEGCFILPDGTERVNANFKIETFDVSSIDFDEFYVTNGIGSATTLYFVAYYQGDRFLGNDLYYNSPTDIISKKTIPPTGTDTVKLSSPIYRNTLLEYASKEGYYSSEELYGKIEEVEKLMKVVIDSTEPNNGYRLFYIRTRYNDAKDIILEYYINNNTLISPRAAYLGSKELEDLEIMTTSNIMTNHSDSTAPLFNSSVYWHLFAQHGYPIPRLNNTVGMTSADVGAVWKDQLDREYTIGDVTDSFISLLPTIYKDANGNDTRGWKTPNSTAISTLTHVSGGSYTTTFETSNASTNQLRPIMKHSNRVFLVDGKEITEGGTYYCDEFKVSESQVGYDPASITTWFPTPVLDNANEMARFTWSYNFKGAQCCANTTIDIRTRVECQSYGATQQQTFFDTGDYKAMFVIPKAASRNGVELDKPFNSPTSTSPTYSFYRTETHLKDINDPIDRLIAFLHNPNDNSYLFGMAAGLSLVSGDTIKEKRIASMPIGDSNGHYRVGSISPSNINKFYIAAINTSNYADDDFHLPRGYFKEINYYVSYFDPNANKGQVYWYKDGNEYIIYAHCQEEIFRCEISLPSFMEGLSVKIVEKTNDTVLLTDKISNGKISVRYGSDAANYIVLKAI